MPDKHRPIASDILDIVSTEPVTSVGEGKSVAMAHDQLAQVVIQQTEIAFIPIKQSAAASQKVGFEPWRKYGLSPPFNILTLRSLS